MAAALRTFDTAEVKPEEIDGLGHMNVRFYMERAQRANRLLLAELGVGADEGEAPGVRATQTDTYVRYQREQFQGQVLSVNGGVLEATPTGLRAFYELANPARGEIAATFIIVTALTDRATGGAGAAVGRGPEGRRGRAHRAARLRQAAHDRAQRAAAGPHLRDGGRADLRRQDPIPMSRRMKWPVPAGGLRRARQSRRHRRADVRRLSPAAAPRRCASTAR